MKYFCSIILFLLYLASQATAKEARIILDAYINAQPVKLGIDTGAEGPVLFRQAANRLNLSITEPSSDVKVEPGQVRIALTEECQFQSKDGGANGSFRFAVIDIPDPLKTEIDGLIGWKILKQAILVVDLSSPNGVSIRNTFDFNKSEWKCLDLRKDIDLLVIKTLSDNTDQDYFLIDTGDSAGLTVRKELCQEFVGDGAGPDTTLSASYIPGIGLVVDKVKWIREIDLGGLPLRDIPIRTGLEANAWLTKEGVDGILGIRGLSCYSWIIDGPAQKIYFKENDLIRKPENYEYNRLGAVFVPEDIYTSNALAAHVVKGGPAWRAGIRDGDELLRIGELDATKWRTNPNIMPLSRFWEKPAGTEMSLILLRDGRQMEINVALEEIFKYKQ